MRKLTQAEIDKRKPKPTPKAKPAPKPKSSTGSDMVKAIAAETKAMAAATKAIADANERNAKMASDAIDSIKEAVSKPQKKEPVRLKVRRYDNDPTKSIDYVDVVPLRKK